MKQLTDKWIDRFFDIAKTVASWSKDKTKVGAVLIDDNLKIVSTGYNGLPAGLNDDYIIDRAFKVPRIVHAEMNAIANARQDVSGLTLFITHPPCNDCAKHIAAFGILRVYFKQNDELASRWNCDIAQEILHEAGVEFHPVG